MLNASQKIWHAYEEKLLLLFGHVLQILCKSLQSNSQDSISVCDQRFTHLPSAHKSSTTCCNVETLINQ